MEQKNKIGVLIPQSKTFPLMGKSFLNGLKLAIDLPNCEYYVESIGLGSDEKQILSSYQKLSYQNGVDLTTGLLGHYGYQDLANFVSQNEEILISADLGAKKPFQTPEGVFQNSLGLYDSLNALVNYFETHKINRIATSTCYYESGYDFIEALSVAMEEVDHTAFVGHFITPLHPREDESEIMEQTMKAIRPDAIVAFHNAVYAKEHAEFLMQNNVHQHYPIYALPFSCEDNLVKACPAIFEQVKVVSSWFKALENTANQKFIASFQSKFGKDPDFFALLGYENGLTIKAALSRSKGSLKSALKEINVEGPRGTIRFNNELNRATYNNYLWSSTLEPSNKVSRKILDKLDDFPAQNNLASMEQHGWHNAYLCH